jgi:NAD+ synthase
MALTAAVFDIDVDAVVPAIERFIAEAMRELARVGIVVPISGGLDSSTVLALCAGAVGPDKVTALLLPDRRGARDALRFGRLVARRLGVRAVEVDTTGLNRAAGVYRFVGYRLPSRLVARGTRARLARSRDAFAAGMRGTDDRLTRQALAAVYARQRLRLVVTYRYADLRRLLVVGSAHKSEDLLGLFVKFGIDDCADVMPLKNLYRTQVLAIAAAVGVPPEVVARTPNPEMVPGIEDKYLDLVGVAAPTVDLVLWGIEHGMGDAEIAAAVGRPEAKVAELRELVRLTAHMRHPSLAPGKSSEKFPGAGLI